MSTGWESGSVGAGRRESQKGSLHFFFFPSAVFREGHRKVFLNVAA